MADKILEKKYNKSEVDTKLSGKLSSTPTSIEFFPASNAGHGGFIDFHYNGSSADNTSRIIEGASYITISGKKLALSAGALETQYGGTGQTSVDTEPTSGSVKMVTSGGVKAALDGKLSLSGGTLTGNLNLPSNTIATGWSQRASATLTNFVSDIIGFKEKSGTFHLTEAYTKNGITIPTGWKQYHYITHNASTYGTLLLFNTVGSIGGWLIIIDGAAIKRITDFGTNSGWLELTNSSVFTGSIRYYKVGQLVNINFDTIKCKNAVSGTVLTTLPEGYRPSKTFYHHWTTTQQVSVLPSGQIYGWSLNNTDTYYGSLTYLIGE